MSKYLLSTIVVGPLRTNSYLLQCGYSGEQVLIDAADEPERLLSAVDAERLVAVVTTHNDIDHCAALSSVISKTGAPSLVHALDAPSLSVASTHVSDGDRIRFGQCDLEVIHIGGHTPGSIVLALADADGSYRLFTGDCLFPGGVGTTLGDSAKFHELLSGVERKLFGRFPDETVIHPGHGKETTLGAERPKIPDWWARGW